MDPILGQIILWAGNWVPNGWQLCDGTLLNVQQYTALYSLLGVKYGGNGSTTFGVPDLRGLVVVGSQNMTSIGVPGGKATATQAAVGTGNITIGVANLPSHTHTATFTASGGSSTVSIGIPAVASPSTASVTDAPGTSVSLCQAVDTSGSGLAPAIYSSDAPTTSLKPFSVSVPGGGGTVTNANTGSGTALPVSVSVPVSVSTLQPSLTLNYIIATQGVYPDRP